MKFSKLAMAAFSASVLTTSFAYSSQGSTVAGCEPASTLSDRSNLLSSASPLMNPPTYDFTQNPGLVADMTVNYAQATLAGCPTNLRNYVGNKYDGRAVGPTMLIKPGQQYQADILNKLPAPEGHQHYDSHGGESTIYGYIAPEAGGMNHNALDPHRFNVTNLHTHGWHVWPTENHDNIFAEIQPGDPVYRQQVDLPEDHVAGTFWYHAHLHGSTALQVASGMVGALVVVDKSKGLDAIPEIQNANDYTMVFQQLAYGKDGQIEDYSNLQQIGYSGLNRPVFVNGMAFPTIDVTVSEVQRWRFIHAGITDPINPMVIKAESLSDLQLISIAVADLGPLSSSNPKNYKQSVLTAIASVTALKNIPGNKVSAWLQELDSIKDKQDKTVAKNLQSEVGTFYTNSLTTNSVAMNEIAMDGLPTGVMPKIDYATLSPGYRVDVLNQLSGAKVGHKFYLVDQGQQVMKSATNPNLRFILAQIKVVQGTTSVNKLPSTTAITNAYNSYVYGMYTPGGKDPFKGMGPLNDITTEQLTGKTQLVHFRAGNDYICPENGGSCTPCPVDPTTGQPGNCNKPDPNDPNATVNSVYMVCDGKDGNDNWMCFTFNPHSDYARTLALDTASLWQVSAKTGQKNHTFHIHVNPFQVQRKFIDPLYVTMGIGDSWVWKDTLKTPPDGTNPAILKSRYTDFTGAFVQHCHVLNHEDQGMMQVVEVRPADADLKDNPAKAGEFILKELQD